MSIKKVASGAQHTLALSVCGKVYGWGDAESGKIGRMLNTRNKDAQALKIEKLALKTQLTFFAVTSTASTLMTRTRSFPGV